MSSWISLGKHGDILSILPMLQEEYLFTSCRPSLIVSKEYSEIPLELDWLKTIIWEGSWQDLAGALRFAKTLGDKIFTPQTHGAGFPIQRKHPSFQLDQYDRCGRLDQWSKLPLNLPRRKSSVEIPTIPFILFADHSQSSPFQHKEDLYTLLKDNFPSHTIVRCSSSRLPRLLDLLALMDAADLLVCVESMHLHLSAACNTPVIALATDTPSRWHGSCYHPRMSAHIRYGDYENRKSELIQVAKNAVNKVPLIKVEIVPAFHEHAYNMSVLIHAHKLLKTYRFHPDKKSWRTEIAMECDGITKPIIVPKQYEKHSAEDGRLFMFRGKPHLSCTFSRSHLNGQANNSSITGYGEFTEDTSVCHITNWVEPIYGDNNGAGVCKNLVFWEYEGRLLCTWATFPKHIVLELGFNGEVARSWSSGSPPCSFGEYRGGTQVFPFEGNWLRFVHANQINKKSDVWWRYSLAAILIESKPPFRILKVSKHPILTGNELYTPDCRHWKPSVIFPLGAIEKDDGWNVACGFNDSFSGLIHLKQKDLNL